MPHAGLISHENGNAWLSVSCIRESSTVNLAISDEYIYRKIPRVLTYLGCVVGAERKIPRILT